MVRGIKDDARDQVGVALQNMDAFFRAAAEHFDRIPWRAQQQPGRVRKSLKLGAVCSVKERYMQHICLI